MPTCIALLRAVNVGGRQGNINTVARLVELAAGT
jgi:hypothetical protein